MCKLRRLLAGSSSDHNAATSRSLETVLPGDIASVTSSVRKRPVVSRIGRLSIETSSWPSTLTVKPVKLPPALRTDSLGWSSS